MTCQTWYMSFVNLGRHENMLVPFLKRPTHSFLRLPRSYAWPEFIHAKWLACSFVNFSFSERSHDFIIKNEKYPHPEKWFMAQVCRGWSHITLHTFVKMSAECPHALATSAGYTGRRPQPWLACYGLNTHRIIFEDILKATGKLGRQPHKGHLPN